MVKHIITNKITKVCVFIVFSLLAAFVIYTLLHGRYTGVYFPWSGGWIVLPLRHWVIFKVATLLSAGMLFFILFRIGVVSRFFERIGILEIRSKLSYRKLSIIFIVIYSCFVFIIVAGQPVYDAGESSVYALSTASLMYCRSIYITEETLSAVKEHFPVFARVAEWNFATNRLPSNEVTGNRMVSYYFPAYSASVIPMSLILKSLEFDQSSAFVLTNALLLVFSLFAVYKYLQTDEKTKLLLLLALGVNPVIFYLMWSSAEVFMYTFVVLAMIFYFNKSYRRAAFFLTIAGSMNMVIMGFAPFLVLSYLIDLQKEHGVTRNILRTAANNISDVIKFSLSFSFLFLPFIHNYIASGGDSILTSVLSALEGLEVEVSSSRGFDFLISYHPPLGATTFDRMLAYITDLNFGLLGWFPILLVFYLIVLVLSILRGNYKMLLPIAGHMLMMFAFSIMIHINAGMTGASRYIVWSAPIMIFVCIVGLSEIKSNSDNPFFCLLDKAMAKLLRIKSIVVISAVLTTGILIGQAGIHHHPMSQYMYMLPQAKFVLDRIPSLYNPLFSTFISRVHHRDGAYIYYVPVIYFDSRDSNQIRKMLVHQSDKNEILDMVIFHNHESRLHFETQLSRWENRSTDLSYINIPPRYSVTLSPPMLRETIHFAYMHEEFHNPQRYFPRGLSGSEAGHTWTSENAAFFLARLDEYVVADLVLDITYFILGETQTIRLYAGERFIDEIVSFSSYPGQIHDAVFVIPHDAVCDNNILELRFEFPDATRTADMLEEDTRILAIAFKEMTISQEK